MHGQAVAIDDVDWDDLVDPHEFEWADEFSYSGTTQDGRHVSLVRATVCSSWELPTAEMAHEHMVRSIVDLLEVSEEQEDFTLAWPHDGCYGQRYFVGTRRDTGERSGSGEVRWCSVFRIGDRADFTEHEDSASALEAALEEAAQLVDHVVAEENGDDAPLIEAFLKAQIHQWHAWLWENTARERVAEASCCTGCAADVSAELAQRLQLSREEVERVLEPSQV